MATRWMKWNVGTHIFEYSTDGVTFNPLPLNASILTEGTIDPARLPAGLPSGGGDNIFTGINTISHVAPVLRFNETDAVANLKNWDIGVNAGTLSIRTLDDAYATPVNLLTISRSGEVGVVGIGAVNHLFDSNYNGNVSFKVKNSNAGASAITEFSLVSHLGSRLQLRTYSSAIADRADVISYGTAGLYLMAGAGGPIELWTSGASRLIIDAAGNGFFRGPIYERARGAPIGEWNDIPFNAANFTASAGAWTVEAGDQVFYKYMLLGRTLFLSFYIGTSTITAAPTDLRILFPAGYTAAGYYENAIRILNNNARKSGIAYCSNGGTVLQIGHLDGTAWVASTNTNYVIGQIAVGVSQAT